MTLNEIKKFIKDQEGEFSINIDLKEVTEGEKDGGTKHGTDQNGQR